MLKSLLESIKSLYRLYRKNNETKARILEDIRALYICGDGYYEPIKTITELNDIYILLENNGDTYKNLSPAG